MQKYFLFSVIVILISCNEHKPENVNTNVTEPTSVIAEKTDTAFEENSTIEIDNNIRSIFQDKNDNYWFGTNSNGVFRFSPSTSVDERDSTSLINRSRITLRASGKTLIQFTEKDGLSNNQVQSIQEDKSGNIWFGTGAFGVSRFDGQSFTTFTNKVTITSDNNWKIEPDDLLFYAGGGVYRYNNNSFTYLPLPKTDSDSRFAQSAPNHLSPYAVYCLLKDSKGNIWFGTQSMGVCRYNPSALLSPGDKTFTWFTENGLAGPAVLALFEDKNGNIWFGNNGSGLFCYSGKSLTNFTAEKKLSNDEFRKSGKAGPGTLARIYSINQDNNGDLWIGTVDAGVWRYDGNNLTNYTTKDGLTSNAVNFIYKDKKGELWFGTDGDGICKFNGKYFTKFSVK